MVIYSITQVSTFRPVDGHFSIGRNINLDFNNEFANMMIELRNKYMDFIAKKIIKSCANAS